MQNYFDSQKESDCMKEQKKLSNQEFSAEEKGHVRAICCDVMSELAKYSIKNGLNEDHPVEKKIMEVGYARDVELHRAKTSTDLDKIVKKAQEAKEWLLSLRDVDV